MLDSYEINSSTLAIIAVSETLSRIIENEREFYVSMSSLEIVENSCKYYGSTYEGRCEATRFMLGCSYKLPIIVEESKPIILFPISSPKFTKCSWFSITNVDKVVKHELGAKILFKTGYELILESSFDSIENQMLRATRLSCILYDRQKQ